MKLPFIQRLYRGVTRHVGYQDAYDLGHVLQRRAAEDSAAFIEEHASSASAMNDADAVLDHAVRQALKIEGCLCEFGVFQGRTLRRIADLAPERALHGFDSFEGLPEDWRDGFSKGIFKTHIPKFKSSNVKLHVGWFESTVPPFVADLRQPIALAHIDCDLYSSTRTVFESIVPYLVRGSIILFDEYFNYPGWRQHEHLALQEFLEQGFLEVRPLTYNRLGQQLAVVVTGGSIIESALQK